MRSKRLISGMKPYGLNCPTCPYIELGTVLQFSNTSKKIEIYETFNCETRNVVYCITCEQCQLQYMGQTTRSLDERVREHIGYTELTWVNPDQNKFSIKCGINIYFFLLHRGLVHHHHRILNKLLGTSYFHNCISR